MADIHKVNSSNIVGGAGRLVLKPYDGTFPDTIEEVMDLNAPFDLKPGWQDVGATVDGITTSRGFDSDDFEVDQVLGPVTSDITGWNHGLSTSLAENTMTNRQMALIGGQIIETPPTLGTATTLTAPTTANATILSVTSAAGMATGAFIQVAEGSTVESRQINRVSGNTVYLEAPLKNAYTTAASVSPITALGTRRIGFGTIQNLPEYTFALISQKKDGTLYMAVVRKARVTGDDKEQTFEKGKRTIPLDLQAFPVEGIMESENVYYELEQIVTP
ncbi:hypothetical protein ACWA2C_27960 [Priestia megaterium]